MNKSLLVLNMFKGVFNESEDSNYTMTKVEFNKVIDKYISELDKFSAGLFDEGEEQPDGLDDEVYFNKSPLVKKIKTYLKDFSEYFNNFDSKIVGSLDKKDQSVYKFFLSDIEGAIESSLRNYFYLGTSVDGLKYRLENFKKVVNSKIFN